MCVNLPADVNYFPGGRDDNEETPAFDQVLLRLTKTDFNVFNVTCNDNRTGSIYEYSRRRCTVPDPDRQALGVESRRCYVRVLKT